MIGRDRWIILSIDLGSSSLKIAAYELQPAREQRLIEGGVEAFGAANATLWVRDFRDPALPETRRTLGGGTPVSALLRLLAELGVEIAAVGHRLVYGGLAHEAPERVTAELMTSLAALEPVDPLHLPDALAAIREIQAAWPDLPQVVCFDTAFHRQMPAVAQRLPLPRRLWTEGVRRYGFHGLSYESIVRELGETGTRGKMVVAHLGSGASLAALRDGSPVDTTMGFSPLGGLVMGTRPGDLDPGVLLYLLRAGRYTPRELDELLTHRSGLLGVSQYSADMRKLLKRRAKDSDAAEAVELFVYQAIKHIGALVAVLGGLDILVFTGGIGAHAAPVRSEIVRGLAFLDIALDAERNAAGAAIISADGTRVVVRVIEANENLMVARHTWATLQPPADEALYPWQLKPKLTSAVWGGQGLVREYGKHADPSAVLGESWECWDANPVTNGPLKGATVASLRERLTARFLGDLDPARIFPILTKIITAHAWLSVQVHPDDAYAQRVERQPFGKTECWYIIAAEPDAQLVVGWTRDTSRAEYERRVADGTLAEILRKVPVKAGDTVYVPAGLVHAIGPGVTVFETQQASDLTYRLFDWNRKGLDGKPRELHVQKAADVLDYRAGADSTLAQIDYHYNGLHRRALIADARFTVERIDATTEPAAIPTDGRPLIVMSLSRPFDVASSSTTTALQRYQTVLIPAAAESCSICTREGSAPFLFVTPPTSPGQFATRLLAAGVPQSKIDAFAKQFAPVTSGVLPAPQHQRRVRAQIRLNYD